MRKVWIVFITVAIMALTALPAVAASSCPSPAIVKGSQTQNCIVSLVPGNCKQTTTATKAKLSSGCDLNTILNSFFQGSGKQNCSTPISLNLIKSCK